MAFRSALLHFLALYPMFNYVLAASISLPSFPLAVKSPYLSAWVPGNQALHAPTAQAQFWTGQQNLTWTILARVNGITYTLFGAPNGIPNTQAATQTSNVTFTSSHTYFHLAAANTQFTLDFFTPVLPAENDYARQSLPYSYLTVSAVTYGGRWSNVEILTGIDYTWTGQNGSSAVNYTQAGKADLFWFYNEDAYTFAEYNDMAQWGSVVYATTSGKSTAYGCSSANTAYTYFTTNGTLPPPRHGSQCDNEDLVAFTSTLSSSSPHHQVASHYSSDSVTFAIGFDRVEAINYLNTSTQTGYYRSQWPTVPGAVDYVLENYDTFNQISAQFDPIVRQRAQSVSRNFGSQYADIIEASVRQFFATFEITIPLSTLSTRQPYLFLKEISSDGNVNTVDLILQSFPIFVSLCPSYLKLVLQPILDYSNYPMSNGWSKNFAIHDIGTHYPNATGHNDGLEEDMPLFESSSIFALLYTYERYTHDYSFIDSYISRLNLYAEYLVSNSLHPATQLISVDAIQATANQTGLAIQSAIGLKAAGALLRNPTYSAIGAAYANQIYNKGLGLDGHGPSDSTHFTYNYGNKSSWGTVFPAYLDVLLDLKTFPQEAWEMQTNWYISQNTPSGLPFMGPYNQTLNLTGGGVDWTITDWTFWVSAASTSTSFQQRIIQQTHAFLTNGLNTEPFGTKYQVEAPGVPGLWVGNRARPTVGSNFALLALQQGTWKYLYGHGGH